MAAPRIFPLGWALVRPFLHEKTANKIRVYGTDREQWKAAILEDVDPSQLPVFYGGSKTDPDGNPQCLTNVTRFTVDFPSKLADNLLTLSIVIDLHGR